MQQESMIETACEHLIDNVTLNGNMEVNPTKDSTISDHKHLVLSEMKKAMRDATLASKHKHALSPEKPSSTTSYEHDSTTTSFSSYLKKSSKLSSINPLPKNRTIDDDEYNEMKSPTKRKIIESLVDDMVKDAFHSLTSDNKCVENSNKCMKRGFDGSSIVTSIVDDVLDKAVCSLNKISEYKGEEKSHLDTINHKSDKNEPRNYFVWQDSKLNRSLLTKASNSSVISDSSPTIHADISQELNLEPSNVQIVCEICCQIEPNKVFSSETDLKTHTLKMHINPLFISPSDLSKIGGISAITKANETKLTAVDLDKLQNDSTRRCEEGENKNNSLKSPASSVDFFWFRCHVCFLLFNAKDSLSSHLSNNHSIRYHQKKDEETAAIKDVHRKKGPGRPPKKDKANFVLYDEQTASDSSLSDGKIKQVDAVKSLETINDNEESLPLSFKKKQARRRKNGFVRELSMSEDKTKLMFDKNRRSFARNNVQPVQPSSSSSSCFNNLNGERRGKNLSHSVVTTKMGREDTQDLEESLHDKLEKSIEKIDNSTKKTENSTNFHNNSSSDMANITEKTASSENNSENSKSLQLFQEKANAWKREMYGNIPPAQELQDEFLEKMSSSNDLIDATFNENSLTTTNLGPSLSSSTKSALSCSSKDDSPAIIVQSIPPDKNKEDIVEETFDSDKTKTTKLKSPFKARSKHKQSRKLQGKKKRKVVKKMKGRKKIPVRPSKQAYLVPSKNKCSNVKRSIDKAKMMGNFQLNNYDNEKCSKLHDLITKQENSFVCLSCEKHFPCYLDLMAHKIKCKPLEKSNYVLLPDEKLLNKVKNKKNQPKYQLLDGLVSKSGKNSILIFIRNFLD